MYIMKQVTMTELRRNLFRLVDEALETGEPIIVNRKGHTMTLVPQGVSPQRRKLAPDDEEGWAKFWAEPAPPGWENSDLSLDALNAAWKWDGGSKLDR
jgi:prevent-host-death family protein